MPVPLGPLSILPTVQVLVDDGTGTFPYDITAKARVQYAVSRGRQDEQSNVTAGQCSLVLDNTDGRFTLGSTVIASPSPIQVNQRIRLLVTVSGTTFTRFTGYVQQWPVAWPTGGDTMSEVTVLATDAQARAERRVLRSVIEEEILADSPIAYYPLTEPAGSLSAEDSSGNQFPPLLPAGDVTFGDTAAGFTGVRMAAPAVPLGTPFSPAEVATATPAATVGAACFGFAVTGLAATTTTICSIGTDINGTGFGSFQVHYSGYLKFYVNGFSPSLSSTRRVDDGALHVAEVQYSAGTWTLFVDGAPADSVAGAAPAAVTRLSLLADNTTAGAEVRAASFSISATAPGTTRAAAHASAILSGFAGESGAARLTRLAGYANLPVGSFDASLTNVPFVDLTGKSAWDALRQVADAEAGLLFVDGSGDLTFHNRNRVPLKSAAEVSVEAEYLDPGTAFNADTQGLVNYVEASAGGNGARQVVLDAASQDRHGRYSTSRDYLVQTDAEAADRGRWLVLTHKDPGPRVGTLVIDLLSMPTAQQVQLLTSEPDSWFEVTGLPSQTPGGTTANFIVQGFSEALTPDSWSIGFNVVDKGTVYPAVFILDSSLLDSDDRLYF